MERPRRHEVIDFKKSLNPDELWVDQNGEQVGSLHTEPGKPPYFILSVVGNPGREVDISVLKAVVEKCEDIKAKSSRQSSTQRK